MKKTNTIFLNTFAAILLTCVFIGSFAFIAADTPMIAYAADDIGAISYIYDTTDVMDDLKNSEGFSFDEYPANKESELQILTFLEYGYSSNWSNYGLYIYLYNPQQKNLSRSPANNKANIATSYDDKGEATSFERKHLVYCSSSEDRLFYKYRIKDENNLLLSTAKNYAETHSGVRRYDIADVEIQAYGSKTAVSSLIGKSYECKGYMKGFGDDKEANTFECNAFSLDVLNLELKHTFFRPDGNNESTSNYTRKDQLNTVYFSFPNKLIEHYGGIWKIAASYYHTKTSPILVTSSKAVYDTVMPYLGQMLEQNNDKQGKDEKINNDIPYLLYDTLYSSGLFSQRLAFRLDWNHYPKMSPARLSEQIIYYLFYADGYTYAKDYTLSGEKLLDYIYSYDKSYRFGESKLQNDKHVPLSMDLFQGPMPYYESSATGLINYVPIEITAEENYTIESYERTPTAFDWFKLYKGKYDYELFSNIKAIEPINESDITLPKETFCKKYYIDESAYNDIISQITNGQGKETVYLFRFAQGEYWACGVYTRGAEKLDDRYAYIAQQDVYLNMNIASVTCRKGDKYHTFAVCSNPINAVADVEPNVPYDYGQYYKTLWNKIKDWFAAAKSKLIASAAIIAVVAVIVLVVILLIKFAPKIKLLKAQRAQMTKPPRGKPKPPKTNQKN